MNVSEIINKDSKVWIVAPHADDEILGCGGLIKWAKDQNSEVYLLFVTLSGFQAVNGGIDSTNSEREHELKNVLDAIQPQGYDILFKDGAFHLQLDTIPIKDIIKWLERSSRYSFIKVKPNIVLIPSKKHNHQDHRVVHDACLALMRTNPKLNTHEVLVLEYEIPGVGNTGYTGFNPNLYFELNADQLNKKCDWFSLYASQVAQKPYLRSLHAIKTLASFRGLESGYEYAEAFNILMWKCPVQKSRLEKIVEDLYLQKEIGLSDVANRLDSNTTFGDFDFPSHIANHLELKEGDRILDVGCGTGKHLSHFRKIYNVLPFGIDVAKKELVDLEINFERVGAESLPYENETFDKLMCNYALYYVDDWKKAIDEMLRVTKPNGTILITGPSSENNKEFYTFHKSIFGELSEIDDYALIFLQEKLETFLTKKKINFEAKTYTNNIVYPSIAAFLNYYTSTSLFRMTCTAFPQQFIINRIKDQIEKSQSQGIIKNTKKIRFITLKKT